MVSIVWTVIAQSWLYKLNTISPITPIAYVTKESSAVGHIVSSISTPPAVLFLSPPSRYENTGAAGAYFKKSPSVEYATVAPRKSRVVYDEVHEEPHEYDMIEEQRRRTTTYTFTTNVSYGAAVEGKETDSGGDKGGGKTGEEGESGVKEGRVNEDPAAAPVESKGSVEGESVEVQEVKTGGGEEVKVDMWGKEVKNTVKEDIESGQQTAIPNHYSVQN